MRRVFNIVTCQHEGEGDGEGEGEGVSRQHAAWLFRAHSVDERPCASPMRLTDVEVAENAVTALTDEASLGRHPNDVVCIVLLSSSGCIWPLIPCTGV